MSLFLINFWALFAVMAATNFLFYGSGSDTTSIVQRTRGVEDPGFQISTKNVTIMHNLKTMDDQIISDAQELNISLDDEMAKYVQVDYIQIDSDISDIEGLDYSFVRYGNCSNMLDIEEISKTQPIMAQWANIMMCPQSDEIKIQGSKMRKNTSEQAVPYKEFRLVVNPC